MDVTLYTLSCSLDTTYEEAIKYIKENTDATSIRRHGDNKFNYEDFQNDSGEVVAQIKTTGYPLTENGFKYLKHYEKEFI